MGVAFIATPVPAIVVIPFGVAILATEFLWARTFLKFVRRLLRRRGARTTPGNSSRDGA
jgi:hypothetical protein